MLPKYLKHEEREYVGLEELNLLPKL
jgi:hypothetical protein